MVKVLKNIWEWIKRTWRRFDRWVASKVPGLKTKLVAGLGALSTFAASMQEYISGLPLEHFVNGTTVALTTGILFTLAFWFRGMGSR